MVTLTHDPLSLLLVLVALINACLGLVVLRAARGPREETRVFSLLAGSVALWCLTNALFRLASSVGAATFWAGLSYLAALATGAAFLHFAWIYPRNMNVSGQAKASLWVVGAAIALLAFLPGVIIQGVDLETRRILTGPYLFAIAAFMLGTSIPAFVLFFNHQKRLRGRARTQARYVLFGSFLTAILGLTFNLIFPLWGDYRFVGLGPLASLFFVGFSSYSIVAHHLFDVRLLIRRTLVYSLLLAGLAGGFAALEKGLEELLHPLLGKGNSFITDLMAALVVGFAVDPLKHWLGHRVEKLFFKNEREEMERFRRGESEA